jgi:hypothetical protein
MEASDIHTVTINAFFAQLSVSHEEHVLCHISDSMVIECLADQRQPTQSVNIWKTKTATHSQRMFGGLGRRPAGKSSGKEPWGGRPLKTQKMIIGARNGR